MVVSPQALPHLCFVISLLQKPASPDVLACLALRVYQARVPTSSRDPRARAILDSTLDIFPGVLGLFRGARVGSVDRTVRASASMVLSQPRVSSVMFDIVALGVASQGTVSGQFPDRSGSSQGPFSTQKRPKRHRLDPFSYPFVRSQQQVPCANAIGILIFPVCTKTKEAHTSNRWLGPKKFDSLNGPV